MWPEAPLGRQDAASGEGGVEAVREGSQLFGVAGECGVDEAGAASAEAAQGVEPDRVGRGRGGGFGEASLMIMPGEGEGGRCRRLRFGFGMLPRCC